MAKVGKRIKELKKKVTEAELTVEEAISAVKKNANAKFDEAIEVAIRLGVDPRKSDQVVRGVAAMPSGTGKKVRVAVLCQGEKIDIAKKAGADIVGFEDLLEKFSKEEFDFDVLIAEPSVMPQLGKHGKVLGPKGLMPNPKSGTVTNDIETAVKRAKSGQVTYRTEKSGIVHAAIGKASFTDEAIKDNFLALIHSVKQAKPSAAKGQYLVNARLSSTMGPAVHINVAPLR